MLVKVLTILSLMCPAMIVTVVGQGSQERFRTVEGSSLADKLDAAVRRASSDSPPTPFWTAYTFDVRPGVAVDAELARFNGRAEDFAGTQVFVGTENGAPAETRNLGIFLLHQPREKSVERVEIYNLDRRRQYDGYPVYWLGRAANTESLLYLRGLAESSPSDETALRATLAIALHSDPSVSATLEDFVRSSSSANVRAASIYWLGQIGGEQRFLADLVRNELDVQKRVQAAKAIGLSKDGAALTTLQSLYQSVAGKKVKTSLMEAALINEDRAAVAAFLLQIARQDADPELRAQATRRLSELAVQHLLEVRHEDLNHLDLETQMEIVKVEAINQERSAQEAMPLLIDIARTHPRMGARAMAIISLGKIGSTPEVLNLFSELIAQD